MTSRLTSHISHHTSHIHLTLVCHACLISSHAHVHVQVNALIPYAQHPQRQGPKLNVAIVTRATHHVYEYASYAYFLQAVYAEHNGYYSLPLFPDGSRPDYQRYRKLVPLLDAMNTYAADADYIVWLDAGIKYSMVYYTLFNLF